VASSNILKNSKQLTLSLYKASLRIGKRGLLLLYANLNSNCQIKQLNFEFVHYINCKMNANMVTMTTSRVIF